MLECWRRPSAPQRRQNPSTTRLTMHLRYFARSPRADRCLTTPRSLETARPSNRSTFPPDHAGPPFGDARRRAGSRHRPRTEGHQEPARLRARIRMTRGCSAARVMVVFRRARSGAVLLRALARRCSSAPSMTPPSGPNYVLHGDWRANQPMSTLHQRGRDGRSLAAVA